VADPIYATSASLDGYIADEDGNFDWAHPSQGVHAFFNDLQRSVGVFLCGRRTYETMRVWDTLSLSTCPRSSESSPSCGWPPTRSFHLVLVPTIVGAGTWALPDGVTADLVPEAEHRFAKAR
jgi:hypothetical protein